MKFSVIDFFSKYETADLVPFTEEICNGKLYFLPSAAMIKLYMIHLDFVHPPYFHTPREQNTSKVA